MLNYNFILNKALESNIDNITIEREYWQLLFLQRLYLYKSSEKVFFKGSTAVRFLLGSFRFSEDLDFTTTLKRELAESLLLDVFNFFRKKVSSDLEFKKERVLKKFEDVSLRYRFLFSPEKLTQKVSIRIDLSLREKPVTKELSVLVPFDYPISPYPLIVHLSVYEILAEKIRALFVRKKPRDLFDIWFLLSKKVKIQNNIVKKKFKLYPDFKFDRQRLKKIIGKFEEKELKGDLNQFLPTQYRNFYKTLKEETLKLITL